MITDIPDRNPADAPRCKVIDKPLCEASLCQSEGRCMGSITVVLDSNPRWRPAEEVLYGRHNLY